MHMQTSPIPRLIGGLPPPICTGSYAVSTGFADELKDGFDADDLQGLNAPESTLSGGVTTYGWTSCINGTAYAMLTATTGRLA